MAWARLISPGIAFAGLTAVATSEGATRAVAAMLAMAPASAARFAGTLAVLAGAWLAARLVDALVWRALLPRRSGHATPRLAHTLTAFAALALGGAIAATAFYDGVSASILTTSSVLLAVLGFALRGVIADIFYGVVIAFERPFQIDDWLRLADGRDGRVVEIGWWSTRLATREEFTLIVPNSALAGGVFQNFNAPSAFFRDCLRIRLSYEATPEQAERVLLAAARDVPASARVPREPVLRIVDFDASGVEYELRFWVPDRARRQEVRYLVQKAVLRNLRAAGLRVARPPMEAWLGRIREDAATHAVAAGDWLAGADVFAPLDDAERAKLEASATRIDLAPGSELLREGEPGDSLFVVIEGLLEARAAAASGPLLLGRLHAGDVIGEMSFLTGAPRGATVTALTGAVVQKIDRAALEPVLQARPAAAEAIARIVAERRAAGATAQAAAAAAVGHSAGGADLLRRIRIAFRL